MLQEGKLVPSLQEGELVPSLQEEETLSLQEGEDVLVPAVPVHHASPVKADMQDEETPRYYYVFLHEPLGQEQIKYVFLREPLGQEQDDDQAGPVSAEVRDESGEDDGNFSEIRADKPGVFEPFLPQCRKNPRQRRGRSE